MGSFDDLIREIASLREEQHRQHQEVSGRVREQGGLLRDLLALMASMAEKTDAMAQKMDALETNLVSYQEANDRLLDKILAAVCALGIQADQRFQIIERRLEHLEQRPPAA